MSILFKSFRRNEIGDEKLTICSEGPIILIKLIVGELFQQKEK